MSRSSLTVVFLVFLTASAYSVMAEDDRKPPNFFSRLTASLNRIVCQSIGNSGTRCRTLVQSSSISTRPTTTITSYLATVEPATRPAYRPVDIIQYIQNVISDDIRNNVTLF